jgi:hypothetical protein
MPKRVRTFSCIFLKFSPPIAGDMTLSVLLRTVTSQKTVSSYRNVRLLFGADVLSGTRSAPVHPRHATHPRLQCVGCNGAITDVRMWFMLQQKPI